MSVMVRISDLNSDIAALPRRAKIGREQVQQKFAIEGQLIRSLMQPEPAETVLQRL